MDKLKRLTLIASLLTLAAACEQSSSTIGPTPPAASVSDLNAAEAPLAAGIPDIAGCWRPTQADGIFSTGPAFYFFRIEPDAFVLGKDAKTKFVVDALGNLNEFNRDPDKPFYPPGFVISSGSVNPENTAIARRFPGDSTQRIYRRCQLVQSAPPSAPVVFESQPTTGESATPVPTLAPLIPKESQPASPIAIELPAPAPSAISPPAPIPEPTPTPRATPVPTATPQPLLTPLVVTPTQAPATATPDPAGASTPPNSTP